MNTEQLLKWREHFLFMLETMELDSRHEQHVRARLAETNRLLGEKVGA